MKTSKRQKIIFPALFIIVVLLALISSCGDNNSQEQKEQTRAQISHSITEEKKIEVKSVDEKSAESIRESAESSVNEISTEEISTLETDESLSEENNAEIVEEVSGSETEPAEPQVTYIGNKNTKKFHYPHCSSVDDMKESNKVYFYGDRQELIDKGYVPCKRCHP